jgi:hypothetical protein
MAANEVAERFAAACWVKFGSEGGEAVNVLTVGEVAYRSRVGFQNRILTTIAVDTIPLFILPLDRVFSRKETSVFANRVSTIGPHDGSRLVYPYFGVVQGDAPGLFIQPIMLEWLGDDLENPAFMPFGLPPAGGVVPGEGDLDYFDAIAVLLSMNEGNALAGDVCISLYQHPKYDGPDEPLEPALPAELPPDPILELEPVAWFRADTWIEDQGFEGRVGTEGNFVGSEAVPAPAPDGMLNDQMSFAWGGAGAELLSSMPAAFWDFLASEHYTTYVVGYYNTSDPQDFYTNEDTEFRVTSRASDDELQFTFGPASAVGAFDITGYGAPGARVIRVLVDGDNTPNITVSATGLVDQTGDFLVPPLGTVTTTLEAFAHNLEGLITVAEYLFFDRTLTPAENAVVMDYFNTRYAL